MKVGARLVTMLGGGIVLAAAAAAGTAAYFGYVPGFPAYEAREKAKLASTETEEAKALVASALLDPDAAKFRSLGRHTAAFPDEPPVSICGEVNGKNHYGAYVGFRRFVVDLKARAVKIDPDNPESFDDADAKMKECKGYAADRLRAAWQACTDDWRRINEAAVGNQTFQNAWTVDCEYPAFKGH